MPNRLALESSPYLRQHRDNPVEWWPWSAEAFAEAKRLDRPVFVSIGYAACHWCHVMAHESFEHEDTARLMNELFVNVKVDREERPDVDAVFMNAIMVMGEGGGWPLSAFCLPDGRPYFLGTYFPREPRFGRPSFRDLLGAMADAYRTKRADAEDNALALVDGLQRVDAHYRRGAHGADPQGLTASLIIGAGKQLAERCDPVHGGMGGKPKFPSTSTHELLGRAGRLAFGEAARSAFERWAKGMAEGGLYDHLGGGFARYSVDEKWLVPHFEKMLYDQAQLLGIYADTVALAGPFAARASEVIAETVAFLARELSDPAGGLWSSLDADSEGAEGTFYVWTPAQLEGALGKLNAVVFGAAYGVTPAGNFEHGTSVLSRVTPRASIAFAPPSAGLRGPAEPVLAIGEEAQLAELRAKLFAARSARPRPGTDDKVLAGWNGLAIAGLVRAWEATGHAPALALAERAATFLRDRMITGGAIARVFHDGTVKQLEGTLEDYAFVADGFQRLAEATGDRGWWDLAARLVATARERFVGEDDGVVVCYLAPAGDALLPHRPESHQDGAIPSGAAVLMRTLVRLGHVAGDDAAMKLAERYLVQRLAGTTGAGTAWANSALLGVLDLYLHGQVVVIPDGTGKDELLRALRATYAPAAMLAGTWAGASVLEAKTTAATGEARAFVCTGPTCAPPVTEPGALVALLSLSPASHAGAAPS